jgi:hypothetical protein
MQIQQHIAASLSAQALVTIPSPIICFFWFEWGGRKSDFFLRRRQLLYDMEICLITLAFVPPLQHLLTSLTQEQIFRCQELRITGDFEVIVNLEFLRNELPFSANSIISHVFLKSMSTVTNVAEFRPKEIKSTI